MTTFDGWDARLCGDAMALPGGQLSDETLMHFRTRGSKNGVRRYQTESGEWTPLGLRERREREGWGESRKEKKAQKAAYKAAKQVVKADKEVAKSERKLAKINAKRDKKAAKETKKAERAEEARKARAKRDLSQLTDDELRARIERAKMEKEYRELKKSPALETGAKLVGKILDYKAGKEERAARLAELTLNNNRIKADIIRAKELTKQTQANADAAEERRKQAKYDAKRQKWDTKGGLGAERAAKLKTAETEYRKTTWWGGTMAARTERNVGKAKNQNARESASVETDAMLRDRGKIDAYNTGVNKHNNKKKTQATGDYRQQAAYQGTANQQKQRAEKAKNDALIELAKQKAEQERQKAEQEKWKSRQRRT